MNKNIQERSIQLTYILGGSLIYAFGFNTFIVPMNLFSGGPLGIAQLLSYLFINVLHFEFLRTVNIASIIYFILNIPLLYAGYRVLGKRFTVKTLTMVALQSAMMLFLPIPKTPIIDDYLTACIVGGIVCGTGSGLVLRGHACSGGLEIVGLICSKIYKNMSVGKITILINAAIYAVCLALFDLEIVIYSLIFATTASLTTDKIHIQNINVSVLIFSKKKGIASEIMQQLKRGVTCWDGEGAYTHEKEHVLYVIVSKYEVNRIKQIVREIDPQAFVSITEGSMVIGNYEKRL
ncbi:MAG: YitT family protein [Lachnospiraceae bacterium]|nr:YitT family protein [Lachnospiraceae bacterium]